MNYVKTEVAPVPADFFVGAKIGPCFFCSQTTPTYDIGALNPSFRCCKRCVKSRGLDALKRGADEATAFLAGMQNKECRHCGGALIIPNRGLTPLWCNACNEEWRSIGA